MSGLLTSLWIITSIAFWVLLIIFIVNKVRKRPGRVDKRAVLITFFVGLLLLIGAIASNIGKSSDDSSTSSQSKSSSSEEDSDSSSSSEDDSNSEDSSSSETSSSSSSSDASSDDPNTYKTGITYDQVARTPNDFKGKKIQFTGKVLQVMEDGDSVQLRLAVDGNYDDVILVNIDNDLLHGSRILEDDLVTASGESIGTVSYDSIMSGKITIPAMDAKIINDQGKASDDYGN
ncbi:hypothetical protein [Leuconostoc holzapfelii]|uniref:TcdA-E operon negative regulator n=1 Tax=Leuconostoc holzapfelii TaxID=434464 RepID=A0A846ZIA4_9LACO|nr:hypothetical protein [Leuconostoc holzapfelii]NKZ18543.1 hypothetical protein [Leuconostoc holzapfelii]